MNTTKTFKNKNFTQRNYEKSNVIACVSETAPNENWIECDESILLGKNRLWIENGVEYYGWL